MKRRDSSHNLRDERGQGLVVALLVLVLLAILVPIVLGFAATNNRNASYSKSAQVANSLAEAGINDAANVLASAGVATSANNQLLIPSTSPGSTCTSTLLPSSASAATPVSYSGGTVKWWGKFATTADCQNWVWTLWGQATVPNPTGPTASPIVKTVSAQVQVRSPNPTNFQNAVWNTIYSPAGPTSGCDTSFGQGVTISVPVYVGGNLCMGQNSTIVKPTYVGGYLFFQNKQSSIGTSSSPVSSAHVGGYCQVQTGGTQVFPCKSEPVGNKNPDTNVWVTGAPTDLRAAPTDSILPNVTAPKICWAQNTCSGDPDGGWYSVASPGPLHPCTTSSGTPPVFDNDTTWGPKEGQPNGSVGTTFNLTPSASYTCQTAQGELSWNATTKVLTVAGTVFIDGSATVSGTATYTGWGKNGDCTQSPFCQSVLYLSGSFSMTSSTLCAVMSGNNCNWNSWNPNQKLLMIVANGSAGDSVNTTSQFQGGLYATATVSTGQQATTEGPLVSGTQIVNLGQQAGGTFPQLTILPYAVNNPPGAFFILPASNFS